MMKFVIGTILLVYNAIVMVLLVHAKLSFDISLALFLALNGFLVLTFFMGFYMDKY